ncbi:UV-stimulated scaffold protein A-like [Diadema antillarum]|uniref:UV-stimulated scaffold protein A-like n=1 Tax=Diadema antillarum TaxID=105358 RepID=UPI003A8A1C78
MATEESKASLDHGLCQQMANLVETLTTTGKPALDQDNMKQLKKICKMSDAYVEHCFHLIITQLEEDHAEIRLSAFQVINELFSRSHRFRELLVADMQEYLELTVETNVDFPLPPPKPAAKLLKEQALRAMQEWHNKFGKAYKKLGLGYTFLKNCKKVDFVNIQARSDAARQREEERQRRLQLARTQKLNKITEEMSELIPEIQECLTQCENCFQLLLPNMAQPEHSHDSPKARQEKNFQRDERTQSTQPSTTKRKRRKTSGSADQRKEEQVDPPTKMSHSNTTSKISPADSARTSIFDLDEEMTAEGKSSGDVTGHSEAKRDNRNKGDGEQTLESKEDPAPGRREGKDDEGKTQGGTCSGHSETGTGGDNSAKLCTKDNTDNLQGVDDGDSSKDEPKEEEEEEREEEEEDREDVEMTEGYEDDTEGGSSNLKHHGLPSWTSINININVDAGGLSIREDVDNTDVLTSLTDQQLLLGTRYLTNINAWMESLTKMGQSDKVKQLIDLKREVLASQEKFKTLSVQWSRPQRKGTAGKIEEKKEAVDDDDDDEGFEAVPEKEGYEADIPEELKREFALEEKPEQTEEGEAGTSASWHPYRDADINLLDPTSQAGSVAAMKERLKKIRDERQPPPGTYVIPPKGKKKLTAEEKERAELLKRAPVVSFGTDLAYWSNPEDIKAPVILRPDTDARTWISHVDNEEVVIESIKDDLKTRVMNFTGSFKPVKWKCRAPLPNGSLCERMDRHKVGVEEMPPRGPSEVCFF